MQLGITITNFSWPTPPEDIGPTIARHARIADEAGFASIWVMDHLFQIRSVGELEEPMLEGMTALGFMAAHTERARLGLMVGAVPYRQPGMWLKATTTLDVLSGGRAWFGIGAAWNVEEARSLGIPFPELPDRFRLLEDTLKMARQAWRGEREAGSFKGRVTTAERLMLSPQPLSQPRIPILVGGGGERTTLRLVARYADACNVFGAPDMLRHKFDVLRRHCDAVGRDYDEIEKTNLATIAITPDGYRGSLTPAKLVERLADWAEAGSHQAIVSIRGVSDLSKIELIGREVIPHLEELGQPSPVDR